MIDWQTLSSGQYTWHKTAKFRRSLQNLLMDGFHVALEED
jgi:hypothetical protein